MVCKYCCRVGIPLQGLVHDLSKFDPREFIPSVRYYQGTSSPIGAERREKGYSAAWLHHKAQNKHHWEYWTDFFQGNLVACTMPWVYATEYVCDMLSASKTYNPDQFKPETTLEYFLAHSQYYYMTAATFEYVKWCLTRYRDLGFKGLKKKDTKAKYAELTAKYPKYELIDKLHPSENLPPLKEVL